MAGFIKAHEFMARGGFIYVDEYATKWEVVARGFGHEFPCSESTYTKKDCATAYDAARRMANELNW